MKDGGALNRSGHLIIVGAHSIQIFVELSECVHVRGYLLDLAIDLNIVHSPILLTEELWLEFFKGEVSGLELFLNLLFLKGLALFYVRLVVS